MSSLKKDKNRLYVGVATSVVSICLIGISPTHAQSAGEEALPAVVVNAPRTARTVRTPQPANVAGQSTEVAPAPVSTMETTRTIGAPPPPYAGGQVAQGGTLGLLGSTSVMNVPFSTVNYTSKVIEDQQARTIADTLINDASVRLTTGSNGFDDTFQIRGFQVPASDIGFNGLYGLISSSRVPAQIVERIELLKGPGALINGIAPGGSIGGGINILSKRAPEVPFTRLTPFFMSAGNYGLHLETSRRFGENKEWGVRFNGVGRNGEASINDGNWRAGLGALSIDYRGERVRWTLDAISQNDDTRNTRPQISIESNVPFIPAPPNARSNWYPDTKLRQRDNTVASGLEIDLTDWLTAYAGIGYRDGRNEQTFPDSRAGGTRGIDEFGNFNLFNSYYDSYTQTVSGNVGFRSQFETGAITHKLNVAYTGFQQEAGNAYVRSAGFIPSNVYNPVPLPDVTGPRLSPQRSSDTTLTSLAIVDTMSVLNDRLLVTLGARQQNVVVDSFSTTTGARTGGYDASATTPLAGVVIKPWHNVSFYANYAEGLTRGTVVGPGYTNTGAVLAPYKSKQQEAGVKIDWGTITTTAAIFQIMRPNSITTASGALAYDGEQRNRGLELSAYGELWSGLRGIASVTFLRPELTNPANPLERGNDAQGVPNRTFSVGLDWDTPWIAGLSLNGRVIYTSGPYLTAANTLRFPDWTRVDVGARYVTAINGKPVTIRASIENLFDETYWLTTGTFVTVASPRTYLVSASFDF
jgi:iron complex outermembrane receptor protein